MKSDVKKTILKFQRNEITEYHIYKRLSGRMKNPANRRILEQIASDEKRHYEIWRRHSGEDVRPYYGKVIQYCIISHLFGFTFAIKLMERGEEKAQSSYDRVVSLIDEAGEIASDENEHENELIRLLHEDRLHYVGSMVLGLNDALVELTGALAGLTFALQNTRLIALTGSITGIAAAFSMAASEYLSTKSEGGKKNPFRASLYTGTAYLMTVMILIAPYLIFSRLMLCLGMTLLLAVAIIAFFNYYISVALDYSFRRRFLEMAGLSLGVAGLSFFIGIALRQFLGVEMP